MEYEICVNSLLQPKESSKENLQFVKLVFGMEALKLINSVWIVHTF